MKFKKRAKKLAKKKRERTAFMNSFKVPDEYIDYLIQQSINNKHRAIPYQIDLYNYQLIEKNLEPMIDNLIKINPEKSRDECSIYLYLLLDEIRRTVFDLKNRQPDLV